MMDFANRVIAVVVEEEAEEAIVSVRFIVPVDINDMNAF